MLVSPGAGFGSRQDKGWASVFPMELIFSLPRSEPVANAMGRPGGGGDPDTGLAHLGALCPLRFALPLGHGLFSPVLPFLQVVPEPGSGQRQRDTAEQAG